MRIRIESHYRHVGDHAMWTAAAQAQFPPAAAANKSRAGQVSDCFRQLALFVAHDYDDPLRMRCNVVSARAAVDVSDFSRIILDQRRVDVAETVDLQRSQEPDIDDAAMNIHPHHVQKTAPARRSIPNSRIGQTPR